MIPAEHSNDQPIEQRVVQISGHGRIHRAFGGTGPLKPARENAHHAMVQMGKCFGGDETPHSEDCNHATKMLEDTRALLGAGAR